MTDGTPRSPLQNFVNGKFVDASDGRTSDVIDPSTGEVYAQAPYIWIGVFKLVLGDGSVAYDKNVVKSFYFDPMWSGATVPPLFNTVTFAS